MHGGLVTALLFPATTKRQNKLRVNTCIILDVTNHYILHLNRSWVFRWVRFRFTHNFTTPLHLVSM